MFAIIAFAFISSEVLVSVKYRDTDLWQIAWQNLLELPYIVLLLELRTFLAFALLIVLFLMTTWTKAGDEVGAALRYDGDDDNEDNDEDICEDNDDDDE